MTILDSWDFKAGKDPARSMDVFICKFREERCAACSHGVPDPELEHGPHRKVSLCFIVIICICPSHVCPCQRSVPERERASTGQSGHCFSFPIALKPMAYGILESQESGALELTLLSLKPLICKTEIKTLALITSQGCLSSSNSMVLEKVFYKHIGHCSYQKLDGENGVC